MRVMRDEARCVEQRFVDHSMGVALGSSNLRITSERFPAPRSAVFQGEVYELEGKIASPKSGAELVRELLEGSRQGTTFLSQVHGSFAAASWDEESGELTLINDRFGMRPLYWVKLPGRFLFSSHIAALMADPDVPRELSLTGVSQFFTFGQYLQDETSFQAIKVLPAASILRYSLSNDRLVTDVYWDSAACDRSIPENEVELLEEIDRLFKRAVDRRTLGTDHLGIAISGGLDARAILGVMDHNACHPTAVCYSMAGSLDHRSSQQMAEQVGCAYHHQVLDADFLANFPDHLEQLVRLTDGQYLSQCIALPTLPKLPEMDIQVLLRGHAGELMHMQKAYAYSVDDAAGRIRNSSDLEQWCHQRLQGFMLDAVDVPLFRCPSQDDVQTMARDSLRQCLQRIEAVDQPIQRIWHLFVQQRLRRETTLSLAKFGSVVEPRIPYLDNDLIEILLRSPVNLKVSEKIQAHILRKRRPEFLRIANANTGTRVGVGPTARRLSSLKLRVLAKLGVPGYQPYERLGLWLRQELADLVKSILVSDVCLDRGIFEPDGVRRVVEDHLANRRNHTFLLMALMIFELGQRRLVDDVCSITKSISSADKVHTG